MSRPSTNNNLGCPDQISYVRRHVHNQGLPPNLEAVTAVGICRYSGKVHNSSDCTCRVLEVRVRVEV